jgi:transcriptional regulator with XRE-family HTH domain
MPESFGARLRQRREQQQMALASIAEQTKIKLALLEALELDDLSHWPAGIFRRAFIRAYAAAIGLEPDIVVSEFLEHHPEPIEVVTTVPDGLPRVGGMSAGPPIRLRYLVASVISFLSRLRLEISRRLGSRPESLPADDGRPVGAPFRPEPDFVAAARLCTELGRLYETRDAAPALEGAARILDAIGLVVWAWDPQRAELKPELSHGYSEKVLVQLPKVRRDADNATAAAFRSSQTCIVKGSDLASGAVVVPLMTPLGCVGVLAVELPWGSEQKESVRAVATIFAAQLATLVPTARLASAVNA